ncbi:MAG: hypothetical protein R2787_09725 [Saprospiraceae bacterium]
MEFHPDRWGTNLFKRISFDVNIQLDPYAQDATGKTIKHLLLGYRSQTHAIRRATFRLTTKPDHRQAAGSCSEGASGREPNDVLRVVRGFGISTTSIPCSCR